MICFLLLVGPNLCFGQEIEILPKPKVLYMIDLYKKPPIMTMNFFGKGDDIDSINVINPIKTPEINRLFNVSGLLYIKQKAGTKMLLLNEVFDLYHISIEHRRARIMVNEEFIERPETLVISASNIGEVKIEKTKKETFIHITEKNYWAEKKKKEEFIKNGGIYIQ